MSSSSPLFSDYNKSSQYSDDEFSRNAAKLRKFSSWNAIAASENRGSSLFQRPERERKLERHVYLVLRTRSAEGEREKKRESERERRKNRFARRRT